MQTQLCNPSRITPPDQRNTTKLLTRLLQDPDPTVSHATRCALTLTIENSRTPR